MKRFQPIEKKTHYIKKLKTATEEPQEEKILDYLDKLRMITDQGSISEDILVTFAMNGMSDEWESLIASTQNPEIDLNLAELYRIGSLHRNMLVKNKIDSTSSIPSNNQEYQNFMKIERKKYGQQKNDWQNKNKFKARKYCFFHEMEGHLTTECRELNRIKMENGMKTKNDAKKVNFMATEEEINEKKFIQFSISTQKFL